ncbi:MAG: hypothetical protein GXY44_10290 [Phycisphaerales bacterium]|nr:hypothetical protein [Phycisphaerales bacterium]
MSRQACNPLVTRVRRSSAFEATAFVLAGALAVLVGSCVPPDGLEPEDGYTITVTVMPEGGGIVALDPAQDTYAAGAPVTLAATPAAGFRFERWEGDAAGATNPLPLTINANVQIQAVFVAIDEGTGDITINKNLRVLPDTVEIIVDADGQATLTGSEVPASIAPGTLLLSTRGEGRLLRVISPAISNGEQTTVATEQAALTDLIQNGTLEFSVPFDPDDVVLETAGMALPDNMKQVRLTRGNRGMASLTFTDHSISLDGWGKVTLDQLTIDFSPDFDFTAEIEDSSLKHLRLTAGTDFHLGLGVSVEAYKVSELISKETTIAKAKWPNPFGFIYIVGGPPIIYQAFLEVAIGAEVVFGDMGTITAGMDFNAGATLGAEYTKGEGWIPIAERTLTVTPHTPEWGITPITARIYVKPKFGMTFFGVVGPSLSWKEYLELAGTYRDGVLGAELGRGSKCDFNLKFAIIDGLPSYTYSHNLFKARQVLLARMLADVDPAGLGTAAISPKDLIWDLYLFNQSLNMTAQPNTGYEVAGWTVRNLMSGSSQTLHAATLSGQPVDASKLFIAGIVPEGMGDSWTGAGTGTGLPTYTVTTEVFPPGAGEIQLFPGTGPYPWGINVLVAAQPAAGFEFHHWEGSLTGDELTGVLEMTTNRSVRAIFASNPPRTLYVPSQYPTLQAALNAATYNDIIHVEAGTHSGDGFHEIIIPRDHVVIEGAGPDTTIIDLADAARLGWLHGTHVTFRNLQIYRGSGNFGGALRLSGNANVAFNNCTFRACQARDGGAVHVSDGGTLVSFTNCRFESNHATSSGGAVNLANVPKDEDHVPILTNCTFVGNTAGSSGGGIAANQCRLIDCTFAQNSAFTGGGGAFAANAILTDCVFTDNTAQNGAGVSAREYSTITGCVFARNIAERDGGGIKAANGVSIQNCVLDANQAGEDGGGIHANIVSEGKPLFIVGCVFTENSAGKDGGGIWCDGTEVSQVELIDNTAGQRGGGIRASYSRIHSGFLLRNRAGTAGNAFYSQGGGIYLEQSNVTNCQLTSNEAIEGDGGGIFVQGSLSDIAVTSVIADVYAAYNTARNGGGLGSDKDVYVLSSSFMDNEASYRGGGIYAIGQAERWYPLVSLCQIENNSAPQGGGAHIAEGDIMASTITGNVASQWGGGLSLFKSTASQCTVNDNTATTGGGGIWTGMGCSILDCVVTDNTLTDSASTGGGGIACAGGTVVSGMTVHGNSPTNCNSDCPACP